MKPLDRQHIQQTCHILAEQGIEMTPDEVNKHRKAALATIRKEMRARGHEMPDSDEELFLLIEEHLPAPPAAEQ